MIFVKAICFFGLFSLSFLHGNDATKRADDLGSFEAVIAQLTQKQNTYETKIAQLEAKVAVLESKEGISTYTQTHTHTHIHTHTHTYTNKHMDIYHVFFIGYSPLGCAID